MDNAPSKKNTNPFNSLLFKVSLYTAGTLLVALLVLAGTTIVSERRDNYRNIRDNADTFARFAASSIYDDYSQFYTHTQPSDFENFKTRVQEIMSRNSDTTKVTLLGLNGRILFDSDEFNNGKYTSSEVRSITDETLLHAVQKDEVATRDITDGKKQLTEIVVPLAEGSGGHVLSMRFLISYDSINERMTSVYNRVGITLLSLTAFVSTVAVLLAYATVRPIRNLTKVAERFKSGDLNIRAEVGSQDELGRLSLTLNSMADTIKEYIFSLKASQTKIEEQYKELRKDEVQLKASINSVNIGFIMTDAVDKVVLLNNRAEHMLAYTVNSTTGVANEEKLRHDWTTDEIEEKIGGAFSFKAALHEARESGRPIREKDITLNGRIVRIFAAPIIDTNDKGEAQILGSVTLLDDITEAKVLERSKEEFFSIASHELRTPLTAIRGNASLIQSYYAEALKDASLGELVGDIHDSSVRLIEIVNDFLDVSRAEQGKMLYHLVPFAIDKVIEEVIYEISANCKQKSVALTFDNMKLGELPKAYADKDRIKQVVYNLLGNSVKFTNKGDTINVSIEPAANKLKIYIKDTGDGMDPEAQRLLFHKFQQAGESLYTRNTERGTGLGLYICRLMLEQMDGSVKLESSIKGKGTTFSFTVPIYTNQVPRVETMKTPTPLEE